MKRAILATAALLALTGCLPEREGPSSDDNGAIIYWELHEFETLYDQCSDQPDGVVQVEAPEFEENSFFVYRLAEDGSRAIAQDCTTTNGETCSDAQLGIELIRNADNTYTWDAPRAAVGGAAGCQVFGDEEWVFTDNGEDGTLDASVTYSLEGESCMAYDDSVKAESPNGLGVDGCTVTIRAQLDYFTTY